ncbi:MAG: ATP-binding protein [Pseudomonadota bacterium]
MTKWFNILAVSVGLLSAASLGGFVAGFDPDIVWLLLGVALVICAITLLAFRQEMKLRDLAFSGVEAIPVPFAIYDKRSRLVACNAEYRQHHAVAFGRIPMEAKPTYRELVLAAVPEKLGQVERDRIVSERLANEAPDDGRMVERYYEGIGWLQIARRRISTGGSVRLAVDITDVKRRQEELETALRRAMEAEQAQSKFLATMNHELRTPLNGVIGMTKLLQASAENDQQIEYLAIVEKSGIHLLNVVNQILDYSRISGLETMTLFEEPFDLNELIADIHTVLRPLFDEKALGFVMTLAPDVAPRRVGDAMRLRQVLLNLIGNAQKFTERGSVEVAVTNCEDDWVQFCVKDTGIGISEADQKTMFERFRQLSEGMTRHHGGTGLGLAITREIVKTLGGDIQVASEIGKGSVFTLRIRLPRDKAMAAGGVA